MFRREGVHRKSKIAGELILGILLTIFSIFTLLSYFGIIVLFPNWVYSAGILEIVLMIVGIFFMNKGLKERHDTEGKIDVGVGAVMFLFGMLPLFNTIGLLKFLPVIIRLKVGVAVLGIILLFAGLYLIVDRLISLFP